MTNTKPIITVVGSFAVGMTLRTKRMPIFGETLLGSDFDMGPGGKGSNQAVAAARLRAAAAWVGILGDDKLAEVATEMYVREGVNTAFSSKTQAKATGVGFIILNAQGDNGIILDMGANELMDAAFVDRAEEQIAGSDIVMTVLEIPRAAAARAMELGKKHNVRTLLNPAPAIKLDREILANADYLTPNESELRILLGLEPNDPSPTEELVEQLREKGANEIIVTLGERGAFVAGRNGTQTIPAIPVNVVDSTGAGDGFSAGLAVALAEGRPLPDAVKFANCVGALVCTRLGVIPGMPIRAAVDRLYAEQYPRD